VPAGAFEVTAPAAGTLLATLPEEGSVAPVFTNYFAIVVAGESAEAFRPRVAGAPAATVAAAPA
jgi:pyruvate/2-oxoglutarate dehydrogenase complex dihydrolipoamide acyltransferase (E2) component